MQRHDGTEYPEDDVRLPLDVGKRRGDEICQCEVENPVAGCGQADTLSTIFQGENFRGINPCRGSLYSQYAIFRFYRLCMLADGHTQVNP